MAISSSDISYRLSGGGANTTAALSLGGAKSETLAPAGLIGDISSAQAAAGGVYYRCIYVHNGHATLTSLAPTVWIQTNTPSSDTTLDIGVGTAAVNGTEQTVADGLTAPVGVSFSAPSAYAGGVSLGDIPAGQHKALWLRYTLNAGASTYADSGLIRLQCDTLP